MRTKILIYTICIYVFTVLQSTILDYIKIFNIKPNLLIILIIAVALLRGNVEGAVVGFFTGLAQDIASGKVIGYYALLGMYLGLLVGSVNKRLYRENLFVIIFFTFVASIVYESAVFFLSIYLHGHRDLFFPFRYIILPEAIYNCIFSVFMFILVIWMHYKIEDAGKITRKY